jgi:hypothetical protein
METQMKLRVFSIGLFIVSVVILFGLNAWRTTLPVAPTPGLSPQRPEIGQSFNYPLAAQLVISAVLLLAALFVVLTKRYPPQDKHWAYGALGTIVGFWLKGA